MRRQALALGLVSESIRSTYIAQDRGPFGPAPVRAKLWSAWSAVCANETSIATASTRQADAGIHPNPGLSAAGSRHADGRHCGTKITTKGLLRHFRVTVVLAPDLVGFVQLVDR